MRTGTIHNSLGMSEPKPVLIFDGHCGFCRIWIDYFRKRVGDRIDFAPSQEVSPQYPQIAHEAFGRAVHAPYSSRWDGSACMNPYHCSPRWASGPIASSHETAECSIGSRGLRSA